jgi:hypothetical protein
VKINCKCGKPITTDLRPFKKLERRPHRYNGDQGSFEYYQPKGTFEIQKKEKYGWSHKDSGIEGYYVVVHVKDRILVPLESILENIVPTFIEGYGCCNYSMGHKLKCKCGVHIGDMYLDCYESGTIKLVPKNTHRCFKS